MVGIKRWAVESNLFPRPKWLQFSTPSNYRHLDGDKTPTLSGSVEKNLPAIAGDRDLELWNLIPVLVSSRDL